jgi:hypothetical protein
MITLPFYSALEPSQRILIAGAGGGFDLFCGLPLYFALQAGGKADVRQVIGAFRSRCAAARVLRPRTDIPL